VVVTTASVILALASNQYTAASSMPAHIICSSWFPC